MLFDGFILMDALMLLRIEKFKNDIQIDRVLLGVLIANTSRCLEILEGNFIGIGKKLKVAQKFSSYFISDSN